MSLFVQPTKDGKGLEIDPARVFKVRRYAPLGSEAPYTEELIWAHSHSTDAVGSMTFTMFKAKEIRTVDEQGNVVTQKGAAGYVIRTFAPGTWYDVEDTMLPPISPNARAN